MAAKYLPLTKAVQEVTGTRPHLSTCIRWATIGTKGILLKSVMLGGRRLTTIEWIEEFLEATTEASTPRAKQAKQSEAMAKAKTELSEMLSRSKKKVAI